MSAFRILTVCTANICRSPASASLLDLLLAGESASPQVLIDSAGTQALGGQPACPRSSQLLVDYAAQNIPGSNGDVDRQLEHRSKPVTAELVDAADLVLALDRTHRSALAQLSAGSRSKTFTLRHAALLARHVQITTVSGALPEGAPPLPASDDPTARLRWLVVEMDAARGLAATPTTPTTQSSVEDWHELDIPDPHVLGFHLHPPAFQLISTATSTLASAMRAIIQVS